MAEEGYAGVNADTPFYRSRAVGVTGVGAVAWPAYRSVLNYDPRANALRGCRVAVEGCMDSSAANYDRLATADSNDWCVARRAGCMMMPPPGDAPAGAALNYDPNATVPDLSACVLRVRGCTSPTALNYRSRATEEDGSCYEPVDGCLDPEALNFECAATAAADAADASFATPATPATPASSTSSTSSASSASTHCGASLPRATVHDQASCRYPPPPPWALIIGCTATGLTLLMLCGLCLCWCLPPLTTPRHHSQPPVQPLQSLTHPQNLRTPSHALAHPRTPSHALACSRTPSHTLAQVLAPPFGQGRRGAALRLRHRQGRVAPRAPRRR